MIYFCVACNKKVKIEKDLIKEHHEETHGKVTSCYYEVG